VPRYGVRVRGDGLTLETDQGRLPGAFFTTRFVDALDPSGAAETVTRAILSELPDAMWTDQSVRDVTVESVWQVPWWKRRVFSGGGFTFCAWPAERENSRA